MTSPFPIQVDGLKYATVEALEAEIARRAIHLALPDRASSSPSAHFERWMREDDTGRTRDAVLEAAEGLIQASDSGDVLYVAFDVAAGQGQLPESYVTAVLERLEAGWPPAGRHVTSPEAIASRGVDVVTYTAQIAMPALLPRIVAIQMDLGRFYSAVGTLLFGAEPDPSVVDVVEAWTHHAMDLVEVKTMGGTASFYPDLARRLAEVLAVVDSETRQAFIRGVRKYKADLADELVAIIERPPLEEAAPAFPIQIDGTDYPDAGALAAELARRGDGFVMDHESWGHPSVYFTRWMNEDDTGETRRAVEEAATRVVADSDSGDAIEHAVALIGNQGNAPFLRVLLDRVQDGVPSSTRWGARRELASRLLEAIPVAILEQLPAEKDRYYKMLAEHGRHRFAIEYGFQNERPDPVVIALTRQWLGRPDASAEGVAELVDTASLFDGYLLEYAAAFGEASGALKQAFLDAVAEIAPDLFDEVAATLGGTKRTSLARDEPAERRWNHCQNDGMIAGANHPIPEDPREFYGPGRLDLVPCSHLYCPRCEEVVRFIDHKQPTDAINLEVLYNRNSWKRGPGLRKSKESVRFYACRCAMALARRPLLIGHHNRRDDVDPLPWTCGGHPAVTGSLELDGLRIAADADIEGIVAAALTGSPPGDAHAPWAKHGSVWVLRLFMRLAQNPLQERIGAAVADVLVGDDVQGRAEALVFYLQQPFAPSSDRLLAAALDHAALFVDVHAKDRRAHESLEFQLLRVLGTRYRLDADGGRTPDARILGLLRSASSRAHLAGATLPTLAHHDLAWVLAHVEEIASASPTNAEALVIWVGIASPKDEEDVTRALEEGGYVLEDE